MTSSRLGRLYERHGRDGQVVHELVVRPELVLGIGEQPPVREQALLRQREESGQHHAFGEVTGRAEEHEDGGSGLVCAGPRSGHARDSRAGV
jgi:hypothetical protein